MHELLLYVVHNFCTILTSEFLCTTHSWRYKSTHTSLSVSLYVALLENHSYLKPKYILTRVPLKFKCCITYWWMTVSNILEHPVRRVSDKLDIFSYPFLTQVFHNWIINSGENSSNWWRLHTLLISSLTRPEIVSTVVLNMQTSSCFKR